jgi:hypothetical protein
MISAVADAPLYTYTFDTSVVPVVPAGPALADWEAALAGVTPGGGTSIGLPLAHMTKAGVRVEQIVLVSDEDENTAPFFADAYEKYSEALKVRPVVITLRVGKWTEKVVQACKKLGVPASTFTFKGDYYALPNVLPLLSQPTQADLLMEIMAHPLPRRRAG